MLRLLDSHAHLDLLDDPEGALARAESAGIDRIITVGIDLESSRRAVGFASRHSNVFAAVGVHPHDASITNQATISGLHELSADSEKVIAIGETGLDYYRDRSPRRDQRDAFILQIGLARETGLPLIVHSREASEDVLHILEDHAQGLTVILHCFSLYDRVDLCVERGYFMSVAGNVTFPKAAALREATARIPEDLLLTETDCPYLTPVPHRGKHNEPAYVSLVLGEIALLRQTAPARLAEQVRRNFQKAFNLA